MNRFLKSFFSLVFIALAINANAQSENYHKMWAQVDDYVAMGLPLSALKVVDEIYAISYKEQNTQEFVKALLLKNKYKTVVSDLTSADILANLESEVDNLWEPAKSIVHLLLGEFFCNFFWERDYQFLRSANSPHAWELVKMSKEELAIKALVHFDRALLNAELLRDISASDYGALTSKESDNVRIWSTLYDMMAYSVANAMLNEVLFSEFSGSGYAFEDDDLLSDGSTFVNLAINEKHNNEAVVKAISVLQQWVGYWLNNGDVEALVNADLARLGLLNNKFAGNVEVVEQTFNNLAKTSQMHEVYTLVLYNKALHLQKLSYLINSETRNYNADILALAQLALNSYPESEGAKLLASVRDEILAPQLTIVGESASVPGKPYVFNVSYNNLDTLYTYLFKLDYPDFESDNISKDEFVFRQIKKLSPQKAEKHKLPFFDTYKQHSAELSIETSTVTGYYCLLVSNSSFNSDFKKMELFSYVVYQASNLAYFENIHSNGISITVVNRDTGMPVSGADVTSYVNEPRTGNLKKITHPKTNNEGRSVVKFGAIGAGSRSVVVSKDDDVIFSEKRWVSMAREGFKPQMRDRLFLFTDRKAYRPGQVVYFKGVLINSDGQEANVVKNRSVEVSMRDVNYRELSRLRFKSNDYGSFSGSFVLPNSLLPGSFEIQSEFGRTSFLVEEYKRPRFEVDFNKFNKVAVLNDEVSVIAVAKTYTGLPLQGANVTWRVKRHVSHWRHHIGANPVFIEAGESVTNERGELEISFKALMDAKMKNVNHSFIITADVTDGNGETRSASTTIVLGQNSYNHNIIVRQQNVDPAQDAIPVTFNLSNLTGEAALGVVHYRVVRLKVPNQYLPVRYWGSPDTILWHGSENFLTTEDEMAWLKYEEDGEISNGEIVVNGTEEVVLNKWKGNLQGLYRIESEVTGVSGEVIKAVAVFSIVKSNDKKYAFNDPLLLLSLKDVVKNGDKAEFLIGSTFSSGKAYVTISNNNSIIRESVIQLNRNWNLVSVPVDESMAGQITIRVVAVKNNRIYNLTSSVVIEDVSKTINLQLTKYTQNVKPGSDQEWQLTIKDANNNPVEAEILALMYDAALDVYMPNSLQLNPFYFYGLQVGFESSDFGLSWGQGYNQHRIRPVYPKQYAPFIWDGMFTRELSRGMLKTSNVLLMSSNNLSVREEIIPITQQDYMAAPPAIASELNIVDDAEISVDVRTRLNETAFFMPHLAADENGNSTVKFTMPDGLTRWRFMALAHLKDGASATAEAFVVSSNPLMVVPNNPRVVRQGDVINFSASVINNSDEFLSGNANFIVKDASTGKILNSIASQQASWSAKSMATANLSWEFKIPSHIKGIEVTYSASSGSYSDGEVGVIAVLPSQTLITETMPITLHGKGIHNFEFDALLKSDNRNFENYTVTYTQNAAWEVLGALPWLMERPHESADQIFNRIFAVSVAENIFDNHPKIKMVLKAWAEQLPGDENALMSALERYPELKSTMLSSSPWLQQALTDSEARKRMASMVNYEKTNAEKVVALSLLKDMQLSDGSWPWFSGMQSSEFITNTIVSGFGYLRNIGVKFDDETDLMIASARSYLLKKLLEKQSEVESKSRNITANELNLLYSLSFFVGTDISETEKFWIDKLMAKLPRENVAEQSVAALVLTRYGFKKQAGQLIKSLHEKLIVGDDNTRYFSAKGGYFWYQMPIESHVLAIEALRNYDSDDEVLSGMENWLVKQKRTQHWRTSRATVCAVYALVASKSDFFNVDTDDVVTVGDKQLASNKITGSGYSSFSWQKESVAPNLGRVSINKNSETPSWVGLHLSYFAEQRNVEEGGFLSVNKDVFKRVINNGTENWYQVNENEIFAVGDRLKYVVSITTPQILDFVHLKAPRAAVFEPVDYLSGYRFNSGLGYYLAISDAATDIFINRLPAGLFKVEWQVTVSHKGSVSCAPVQVSCFYAPDFAGHSSGGTINAK